MTTGVALQLTDRAQHRRTEQCWMNLLQQLWVATAARSMLCLGDTYDNLLGLDNMVLWSLHLCGEGGINMINVVLIETI